MSTSAATDGTFTLTYVNETTDHMAHDISKEELAAELMSLPSLRHVVVSRSSNGGNGYHWDCTMLSEVGDLPNLVPNGQGLNSGASISVTAELSDVACANCASVTQFSSTVSTSSSLTGTLTVGSW